MSLRLVLAPVLVGGRARRAEILRVEAETNAALDGVMGRHGLAPPPGPVGEERDLAKLRSRMARGHRLRVSALADAIGAERASDEARAALGPAGERLGASARSRLGVGDSLADLERAATFLYKILDIDIGFEEDGGTFMVVSRCSLSSEYDPLTCKAMSAADEGMMHGLSPSRTMRFERTMTESGGCCRARLRLEEA